jgi:serine protease Do
MILSSENRQTPLAQETARLVEALRNSVVLIQDGYGHGSGTIWSPDGLILTNHHVVKHNQANVELYDGHRYMAQVIARDPFNDLAALLIEETGLPAVSLGDSRALRVGELVIALGNPLGVLGIATMGIICAVGNATWMGQANRELLQADIALAPGNSGGPLADTSGRVVGIASMILSPNIALAVPTHVTDQFVQKLNRARDWV